MSQNNVLQRPYKAVCDAIDLLEACLCGSVRNVNNELMTQAEIIQTAIDILKGSGMGIENAETTGDGQ